MAKYITRILAAALFLAGPALAQTPADPFPTPIAATEGVIRVNFAEFASIPDLDGVAARMMNLVDERGSRRIFVNDMRGPLYSVSYDGKTVALYVNINDPKWASVVCGRERGSKPPSILSQSTGCQIRQVLHLYRHHQPDAGAGLQRGQRGDNA
jgi:hypothetical protein